MQVRLYAMARYITFIIIMDDSGPNASCPHIIIKADHYALYPICLPCAAHAVSL